MGNTRLHRIQRNRAPQEPTAIVSQARSGIRPVRVHRADRPEDDRTLGRRNRYQERRKDEEVARVARSWSDWRCWE